MGQPRRGALSNLDEIKKQLKANEKFAGNAVATSEPRTPIDPVDTTTAAGAITAPEDPSGNTAQVIPIDRIVVRDGFNVRSEIPQDDEFELLVQGMAEIGLMQPIVVVPHGHDQYAIVLGHRRLMAAKVLGWADIPVRIETWDEETQTRANYMENRHRANVSPYDDAKRAVDIMERRGWSLRKTAAYLGDNLGRLSGLVRIYRNPQLRLALEEGRIPLRWLRSLVQLVDQDGAERIPDSIETFLFWLANAKPSEAQFKEAIEAARAQGVLPGRPERTRPTPTPLFERVWQSTQKLEQLADRYQTQLSAEELLTVAQTLIAQGEKLAETARRRGASVVDG